MTVTFFDLVISASCRGPAPWTKSLPTLVSIARAVCLLECGHVDTTACTVCRYGLVCCQMSRGSGLEYTEAASPADRTSNMDASRLNGGGPWLYQQQQQQQQPQQRGPVMANGSARMLLQVPPPPHQPARAITAAGGPRPSNVSRGKCPVSCLALGGCGGGGSTASESGWFYVERSIIRCVSQSVLAGQVAREGFVDIL